MTKTLDSTAVYAYTTLISVLICVPLALMAEGSMLMDGMNAAIAKVGAQRFWFDLFMVGLLYHLYNQVSNPAGAAARTHCQECWCACRAGVWWGRGSGSAPALTLGPPSAAAESCVRTWLWTSSASARARTSQPGSIRAPRL